MAKHKCEGSFHCWHNTTWREDLQKWLCDYHHRKLNKLTIGDIYS